MHKKLRAIGKQIMAALLAAIFCSLSLAAQSQARSLYREDFTRINENGFGSPDNSYAWSMAWFKGRLYVGTMRNVLELRAFSETPPPFDPYPVPVPDDPRELDLRAEIWQYTPGTDTWKRVYQSEEFLIVLPDSTEVWTARDIGYRVMAVYTDQQSGEEALYVGTNLYIGAEARILRTTDGENFQALTFDPGIELPEGVRLTSFRSLVPFNGRLYTTPVSTGGTIQGSEVQIIFESVELDLVNNIFHFRPASPPGFDDPTNLAIFEMAVFNNYLYAGTGNMEKGYQVWKTDASGEPPYTWTPVVIDGAYRGPLNQGTASMFPFSGSLYVGGGIQSAGLDLTAGLRGQPELIRINPDDSWELICGESRNTPDGFKNPLSDMGPGFDNIFTAYFWRMQEHNDWLYLGTLDNTAYLPYLPFDELPPAITELLELIGVDRIVNWQGGFDLWKTRDGIQWYPVTIRGFGNPLNTGLRTFQSTPAGLFVGTANPFTAGDAEDHPGGAEVWQGILRGQIIIDSDDDGILDEDDNCSDAYNPDQTDSDGDGLGNICDERPRCGDGIVHWHLGENCEIGVGNECGVYAECIDCVCVSKTQLCGDGIIQWKAGETCDPPGSVCGSAGNLDWMCNDTCQCRYVARCGDGRVQWKRGEECEPVPGLDGCGPGRICNPDTCRCVEDIGP